MLETSHQSCLSSPGRRQNRCRILLMRWMRYPKNNGSIRMPEELSKNSLDRVYAISRYKQLYYYQYSIWTCNWPRKFVKCLLKRGKQRKYPVFIDCFCPLYRRAKKILLPSRGSIYYSLPRHGSCTGSLLQYGSSSLWDENEKAGYSSGENIKKSMLQYRQTGWYGCLVRHEFFDWREN